MTIRSVLHFCSYNLFPRSKIYIGRTRCYLLLRQTVAEKRTIAQKFYCIDWAMCAWSRYLLSFLFLSKNLSYISALSEKNGEIRNSWHMDRTTLFVVCDDLFSFWFLLRWRCTTDDTTRFAMFLSIFSAAILMCSMCGINSYFCFFSLLSIGKIEHGKRGAEAPLRAIQRTFEQSNRRNR